MKFKYGDIRFEITRDFHHLVSTQFLIIRPVFIKTSIRGIIAFRGTIDPWQFPQCSFEIKYLFINITRDDYNLSSHLPDTFCKSAGNSCMPKCSLCFNKQHYTRWMAILFCKRIDLTLYFAIPCRFVHKETYPDKTRKQ